MEAPAKRWHPRHPDKAITDRTQLLAVVRSQKHLTLAVVAAGRPYLATVNFGFDEAADSFYFHCSRQGRKADAIRENPGVYGQVLDDRGYLPGECDHAFAAVQFEGRAEFVEDVDEKRRALALLIDHCEPDPGPVKARLLKAAGIESVGVVRVAVASWSGKANR
jgi:nitroimidazol reductase NimA-like FMN-containing flavoprotein (pyridoxamine 5'-phosphate oxidase superfamily)